MDRGDGPAADLGRRLRRVLAGGLFAASVGMLCAVVRTAARSLGDPLGYGVLAAVTDHAPLVVFVFAIGLGASWLVDRSRERLRWTRAFVLVAVVSVSVWVLVGGSMLMPVRYKGIEHPIFYPSEFCVILGTPLTAAGICAAAITLFGGAAEPSPPTPPRKPPRPAPPA